MDDIIKQEDLKGTYAYIDNVTICEQNQAEHYLNLKEFMNSVVKYGFDIEQKQVSLPAYFHRLARVYDKQGFGKTRP